jgi:hypothetical protein
MMSPMHSSSVFSSYRSSGMERGSISFSEGSYTKNSGSPSTSAGIDYSVVILFSYLLDLVAYFDDLPGHSDNSTLLLINGFL